MPQRSSAQTAAANNGEPVVYVVDDDAGIRSALRRLLTLAGIAVEPFDSGASFLAAVRLDRNGCVLLDVRMPGMDGLEVQAHLNARHAVLPVIFLTGAADIPMAVAAMREGAVDFIEKPFDNAHLVERVRQALERSREVRQRSEERSSVQQRLDTLTPREQEVMELVVTGRTSKEIARELGASHRTIEIHRTHVMEKMAASTLADLVRMRLLARDELVHAEPRAATH